MNETEELLFEAIKTVADGLSLQVKWPNRQGPIDTDKFVSVVHIPNGSSKTGWRDIKAEQGVLNIGVCVEIDHGATDAAPIVSAFRSAFAQSTVLLGSVTRVEIYMPPRLGAVFEDGQKAVFPVTVFYRSFAN